MSFSLSGDARESLEENFPNGAYIQGYLYASTGETDHSIPVLGFYGSWTDPSMFDVGSWPTFETGEDKVRIQVKKWAVSASDSFDEGKKK